MKLVLKRISLDTELLKFVVFNVHFQRKGEKPKPYTKSRKRSSNHLRSSFLQKKNLHQKSRSSKKKNCKSPRRSNLYSRRHSVQSRNRYHSSFSKPTLDYVAQIINDDIKIGHLVIEGHASEEGEYKYNYDLSNLRARAIYKALVDAGVHPDRMSYRGLERHFQK